MSLSLSNQLFLLDGNVRAELLRFLKTQNVDVKLTPKEAADHDLAAASKKEKRILVTNDEDFIQCRKDNLYAVILLRLPQNDPERLVSSFTKLLTETKSFAGKLIVLRSSEYKILSLGQNLEEV